MAIKSYAMDLLHKVSKMMIKMMGWVQLWSGTTVVRSTCGPGPDHSGADHSGTPPVFFIQSVIFMNVGLDKLYLNIFILNNEYFLQK